SDARSGANTRKLWIMPDTSMRLSVPSSRRCAAKLYSACSTSFVQLGPFEGQALAAHPRPSNRFGDPGGEGSAFASFNLVQLVSQSGNLETHLPVLPRHPGEGRDPLRSWIPAFAGMTNIFSHACK